MAWYRQAASPCWANVERCLCHRMASIIPCTICQGYYPRQKHRAWGAVSSSLCGFLHSGDFTRIGSAYRPDPTIESGLTPEYKGTRFLCLVLTNRSPRKLKAQGDSKQSRVNPWCDRPRFFHFKIGLRQLLHISCKSRMQHGMIFI